MSDPLDEILGPRPVPPAPEGLYPLTVRALRRARRRQRAAEVASLLACAAGLALLLAMGPACPGPLGRGPGSASPPFRPGDAPAAVAVEWRALEGPGPAAPVYAEAGDRYLAEGDPGNAARCYGHALSAGASADISDGDNFLLMAIKLARKKEGDTCGR